MMTQPIQMFENLTSETAPAGGNASKVVLSFEQRHYLERRAREERAEVVAKMLGDAFRWLGRQYRQVVAALTADYKLRIAEAQLYRMSDRELADLGLGRSDIPFAVREAAGETPQIDVTGMPAAPANSNLRRAA
jgi:hypothetical protein